MVASTIATASESKMQNKPNVKNVIVAGAGPAGLLLTSLLLHRNQEQKSKKVQYKVTLVEGRPDLGNMDPETELKKFRSWMLALADHGLEALKTLPDLYDNYVADVGIPMKEFNIFLGAKEIKSTEEDVQQSGTESFVVDRNFVVAAMSRYLNETHGKSEDFRDLYNTKLMYVDDDNHRILIRDENNQEKYISYDLLVGADGARSTVREAVVKGHSDFELQVNDIFQTFKAVHIDRPKAVSYNAMTILPAVFPKMQGIALPEKDGKLNISIGVPRNSFDEIPKELKSDDPKVVAAFMREQFKPFVIDYDDFADQWAASRWNRTYMVHCNFYHSLPAKIVIMGDAAHATSPSIGMGMNTALRDAQSFYQLLVELEDDLEKVLPRFSEERVKEGNSLSDLAYYLYCNDETAQMVETLHLLLRTKLHKFFPSLVRQHPQALIGNNKYSLAEVYQAASDLGIIQKHRRINDSMRQEFFELQTGMITEKQKSGKSWLLMATVCAILLVYVCQYQTIFLMSEF